ncbi:MAG: hypothetical protein JWM78_1733 [Verrucomicrobiaceae bacterium]|nr:hypothetical protein [Verrucomicrobiaceae bacterium]
MTATLKQIQQTLQNYLLDPQSLPSDLVVETEKVTKVTRLGIYGNAYRVRIVEALAADYQSLKIYLGDDAFAELIIAYIEVHPSHYFSMRWVGSDLCEFIRTTPPYCEHLDLYELAHFEWTLCHAFDAVQKKLLSANYFAALLPEQWTDLLLEFAPSLQIIALSTNTPQLWRALNADENPPAVVAQDIAQPWLVWRQQLKLMFRPATPLEVTALAHFQQGYSFSAVCELLSNYLPEQQVPAQAVGLLQQWLQDELIVAA